MIEILMKNITERKQLLAIQLGLSNPNEEPSKNQTIKECLISKVKDLKKGHDQLSKHYQEIIDIIKLIEIS